jgi:hypothetical protein
MSSPRLAPRADATPESSRVAISRCYDYLIERHRLREQKEAAGPAPEPDSPDMRGDLDRVSHATTES